MVSLLFCCTTCHNPVDEASKRHASQNVTYGCLTFQKWLPYIVMIQNTKDVYNYTRLDEDKVKFKTYRTIPLTIPPCARQLNARTERCGKSLAANTALRLPVPSGLLDCVKPWPIKKNDQFHDIKIFVQIVKDFPLLGIDNRVWFNTNLGIISDNMRLIIVSSRSPEALCTHKELNLKIFGGIF